MENWHACVQWGSSGLVQDVRSKAKPMPCGTHGVRRVYLGLNLAVTGCTWISGISGPGIPGSWYTRSWYTRVLVYPGRGVNTTPCQDPGTPGPGRPGPGYTRTRICPRPRVLVYPDRGVNTTPCQDPGIPGPRCKHHPSLATESPPTLQDHPGWSGEPFVSGPALPRAQRSLDLHLRIRNPILCQTNSLSYAIFAPRPQNVV